jgi:hypothetical protein
MTDIDSPKMIAGVDLIRRTGAIDCRIGYSDPDDGLPVVWYACCTYLNDISEAAGALDPEKAVLRLCETLVDGGECAHCTRPSVFEENFEEVGFYDLVTPDTFCVYGWDPELNTFRRGCEGT